MLHDVVRVDDYLGALVGVGHEKDLLAEAKVPAVV